MILENISNYIIVHNGIVVDKKISDEIHIDNNTIIVDNAKELQIIYKFDQDNNYQQEIIINDNNHLDLIEMLDVTSKATFNKNVTIKDNVIVEHYHENNNNDNVEFNYQNNVSIARNSDIKSAYVELGENQINSDVTYDLNGEESRALIRLAAVSKKEEKKHYKVSLNHYQKNTYGNMDNYGFVQDKASLVIDGYGRITKGNKGASTHQTNKIIVFDEGCKAQANPYLYIDEYDVKASHGASVGKINEDHLYYLQSRGLSKKEAMHLVTLGYFIPVLEFINNEALKEKFNSTLKERVEL